MIQKSAGLVDKAVWEAQLSPRVQEWKVRGVIWGKFGKKEEKQQFSWLQTLLTQNSQDNRK